MSDIIFAGICIAAAAIIIIYHFTRRNRWGSIISSTLTGVSALCLLSHFGSRFGTDITLNVFNIFGSVILGVPFLLCNVFSVMYVLHIFPCKIII